MKNNTVALAIYRTVKAANDDEPNTVSASSNPAPVCLPFAAVSGGWDPFEVWRTRIRVIVKRVPRSKF